MATKTKQTQSAQVAEPSKPADQADKIKKSFLDDIHKGNVSACIDDMAITIGSMLQQFEYYRNNINFLRNEINALKQEVELLK